MAAEGLAELALTDASGETVAVAVLKDAAHRQPVFVSAGHRVSLATATNIVRRCCLYKVRYRLCDMDCGTWESYVSSNSQPVSMCAGHRVVLGSLTEIVRRCTRLTCSYSLQQDERTAVLQVRALAGTICCWRDVRIQRMMSGTS